MASPMSTGTNIPEEDREEESSFISAMKVATSIVVPMAVQSAIDLGVFDILAKAGPGAKLSLSQIVEQMSAKNPEAPVMLDRIFTLLVGDSLLRCSEIQDDSGSFQRFYSLSPVSKHFVSNQDGASLGPFVSLIQDKVFLESWSQLKDAILDGGIPFNRFHGMPVSEYRGKDARFNQLFNKALVTQTPIVMMKLLESYTGFQEIKKLVDISGNLGVALNLITSRYPHIKGINYDLPDAIQHAPQYPGVKHVGGDMFNSIPKGDAILLKRVLHQWSDEQCVKLLKNCYNATPKGGKVIVVEAVLPTFGDVTTSFEMKHQMDVLMMVNGGKERRMMELHDLAFKAGFSSITYACFVCNYAVMEFIK